MALEALVAIESGLEEFYQLRRPLFQGDISQQTCIALVVMKRQGGLLVAVPLNFFGAEDRANINMLGANSSVGPRTNLTVPAERETDEGGRESVEDIEITVFDLDGSMAGHFSLLATVSEEAQDLMMCFVEEDPSVSPESDGLLRFVKQWVEVQASSPGNLGFYSAAEVLDAEEKVPETPRGGRKKTAKDPPGGERPKRVTTAVLAEQIQGLMDALPKLSEQMVLMQESQQKMKEEMLAKASVPPVRPSQMPISTGLPLVPSAAGVAQMLGSPPRVRQGASAALGATSTVPKASMVQWVGFPADNSEQAEEIEGLVLFWLQRFWSSPEL